MAKNQLGSYLVRLRPRPEHLQVSRGRTVLVTDREGLIQGEAGEGLFVHQTRLLSRWEYRINKIKPTSVTASNVQQHSWLGYYIAAAPGVDPGPPDLGSGEMEAMSEETLELKISRFVGEGLHEDLDLTNYSLQSASVSGILSTVELSPGVVSSRSFHHDSGNRGRLSLRTHGVVTRGSSSARVAAEHYTQI